MPYYEELSPIVSGVIGRIFLRNQKLCKLLHYYPDTSKHDSSVLPVLNYSVFNNPDIENTNQLFMTEIFPIPKLPEVNTRQSTYLTVTLNGGYSPETNDKFRNVNLMVDIISHIDTWVVEEGYRPYLIMHEVDKGLNNQLTDLPIVNKPYLIGFQPRDYSNFFYGFQLLYKLTINSNVDCNSTPLNLTFGE